MAYENIKDKELHRVALTSIVYRSDMKFLIVRRALDKKVYPGKWTVPGGGLNVDDYINRPPTSGGDQWYDVLEDALRREVREETNIEMEKPKYLCDISFIQKNGTPVIVLSYYAPYVSGIVKLDSENIDYKWVSVDELQDYDLIPGIVDEIKEVYRLVSVI